VDRQRSVINVKMKLKDASKEEIKEAIVAHLREYCPNTPGMSVFEQNVEILRKSNPLGI